jgi:hypothetical protein
LEAIKEKEESDWHQEHIELLTENAINRLMLQLLENSKSEIQLSVFV